MLYLFTTKVAQTTAPSLLQTQTNNGVKMSRLQQPVEALYANLHCVEWEKITAVLPAAQTMASLSYGNINLHK